MSGIFLREDKVDGDYFLGRPKLKAIFKGGQNIVGFFKGFVALRLLFVSGKYSP